MRISTKEQRDSTSAHPIVKQACVHIRREEEVSDEEQQGGSSNLKQKQKGGGRKEDEPMRMTSAMAGGDG